MLQLEILDISRICLRCELRLAPLKIHQKFPMKPFQSLLLSLASLGLALSSGQAATITDGLVFYAPFDTTTSNTIDPPGQAAATVGSAGITLSAGQQKFGTQSLYNPAANHTTSSSLSYADGTPSFDIGTGDFALSAWIYLSVNPTGTTVRQYAFNGMNSATHNLAMYVRDRRLVFFLENGTNDIDMATPVASLTSTGTWVNLIANIYDDGSSRTTDLYINGSLSSTQTKVGVGNTAFTSFYLAGASTGSHAIQQGYMDDAAIWKRALTTGEIASIQTGAIPEPSVFGLCMAGLAGILARRRRNN
jgi:hypothetical protein